MTRLKALFLSAAIGAGVAMSAPAHAQASPETLADIRQELSILFVDVQRLKTELSTTGAVSANLGPNTPLQRVDAIEAELQRLTSKTEELENRINRVVTDGTNRLGDLEFRLVELEGGDLGAIGQTLPLGGEAVAGATLPPPAGSAGSGPELAVGEKADFERAQGSLASGDFRTAADQFAAFTETYPGGPLSGEAHYLRGDALEQLGDTSGAARAYLESFSGSPSGPKSADALYKLGTSLGALGQTQEACVTLGEVGVRFPTSPATALAQTAMRNLSCN